ADSGPLRSGDLVAHERQQRGDDEAGPGAGRAQHSGGDEVHRGLAPTGALDDEDALLELHEVADRLELTLAELRVRVRGELGEDPLRLDREVVGGTGRVRNGWGCRGGFRHGASLGGG